VEVKTPQPQIAVILAAGSSSRFVDGPKQLARLNGQSLVAIAAQAALDAGCFASVLVVAGAVLLDGIVPDGVVLVENPLWASGQASSLLAGIAAARAAGAQAVVVGLADQPFVTPEAWQLVSRMETERPIVAATYAGQRGNPVRLGAEVWDDLPNDGDEGARALLRGRPELVAAVACPGDASDVDTVEDLEQWN
jgi:CTP:molybdopterin cytidylyltransferase MocA